MRSFVTSTPIDLKVQRADRHRQELVAAVEAFKARNPYKISEHRRKWRGVTYRILVAHDPEPAPDDIGLMLGDFIHNLRASLDYLVGAIRPGGATEYSAFPIRHRKSGVRGFDALTRGTGRTNPLADVPSQAKKAIERMQPYDRGRRERLLYRSLADLDALWQIEKHRSILLTTPLVWPSQVGYEGPVHEPSGVRFKIDPSGHEAEWWLPVDKGDAFDPQFAIEVAVAHVGPHPLAADGLPRPVEWEALEAFVDEMYNTVVHRVLPKLHQFIT